MNADNPMADDPARQIDPDPTNSTAFPFPHPSRWTRGSRNGFPVINAMTDPASGGKTYRRILINFISAADHEKQPLRDFVFNACQNYAGHLEEVSSANPEPPAIGIQAENKAVQLGVSEQSEQIASHAEMALTACRLMLAANDEENPCRAARLLAEAWEMAKRAIGDDGAKAETSED